MYPDGTPKPLPPQLLCRVIHHTSESLGYPTVRHCWDLVRDPVTGFWYFPGTMSPYSLYPVGGCAGREPVSGPPDPSFIGCGMNYPYVTNPVRPWPSDMTFVLRPTETVGIPHIVLDGCVFPILWPGPYPGFLSGQFQGGYAGYADPYYQYTRRYDTRPNPTFCEDFRIKVVVHFCDPFTSTGVGRLCVNGYYLCSNIGICIGSYPAEWLVAGSGSAAAGLSVGYFQNNPIRYHGFHHGITQESGSDLDGGVYEVIITEEDVSLRAGAVCPPPAHPQAGGTPEYLQFGPPADVSQWNVLGASVVKIPNDHPIRLTSSSGLDIVAQWKNFHPEIPNRPMGAIFKHMVGLSEDFRFYLTAFQYRPSSVGGRVMGEKWDLLPYDNTPPNAPEPPWVVPGWVRLFGPDVRGALNVMPVGADCSYSPLYLPFVDQYGTEYEVTDA